jgi:hypothetical protein
MSSSKRRKSEASVPHRVQALFCDNCSSLALAQLDKKVLCDLCLIDIVKAGSREDIDKIAPLSLSSRVKYHR